MTEVIQKITYDDRGNLAANCSQIFTKGPQITKEIVTKITKTELGNDRKFICGHEFKTRHIWILAGLLILFSCSFFLTIALCFTNFFDTMVLKNLVLQNGSKSFEGFMKPKAGTFVRIHIFNYTNVEDFEKGRADKLHVEDVGPYVFQETVERVNGVFENERMLTFQEKRSYKFLPEMSNGRRQSDQLVVPNLPMLGTIAMVRDTYFMTRLTLSTVLKGLNAKPFLNLPAQKFIWGYDDSFFNLVKGVLAFQHELLPFEKFGLLSPREGLSTDRITIDTGAENIDSVGKILRFNGEEQMVHWSTDECNRIDGTMGTFFSPLAVRSKKPLSIYIKEVCRKLNYYYDDEVKVSGDSFPAYRYKPSKNMFAHPNVEPSNQCFCDLETGVCPPHGIMNSTPCSFGPVYLSFPHFLYGDPTLLEAVDGVQPDEKKHSSYLDIHPTFGYTMQGRTSLQLNTQVRKAFGIPQVDMFADETMLPVVWFDNGIDAEDFPPEVQDVFYLTSYTVPYLETGLKYGCILMSLITFIAIVIIVQGRIRSRRPISTMRTIPPFQRNISGLDALIN